ncbi:Hydroxysteroid dehydrogenase like 2 [Carabus blaptoides fortunei]
MNTGKLAGLTILITGASRGIGKAIALKAARDGANIVIAAKTAEPHPKLPGTIYSAAKEVEQCGGKCLPCIVDVRDEKQVRNAVEQAVSKFGGIDVVINNASAISLTGTAETDMKRYDLMHNINTRGTFLMSKECLPYLKKSKHPHILNISPPLSLNPRWFASHVAYTMAKYGMSMCVLGMATEFKPFGIGVNALWPKTAIHTAAIEMLTGPESANWSRKPEIVADAAYAVLIQDPKVCSGQFLIDEDVLQKAGITSFDEYACNPEYKDKLMHDFFLDDSSSNTIDPSSAPKPSTAAPPPKTDSKTFPDGKVGDLFGKIQSNLNGELVSRTKALYQFNLSGAEAGVWYIDLRAGEGNCGHGDAPEKPDATLAMDSKHFFDMFSGKMKPSMAYMMGKLKITGNLQKAMKLEKLMGSLKSKL